MAIVVSHLPYTRGEAKAWGRETMRGFINVFPTPFTADDAVDHGALRRNLEKLRGIGLDGFLSGGNIAEGWNMTPTEWMAYSETVADVLAGQTPHLSSVILDPSPYTAIEKVNRLATLGFNAMEVITPIFALRNDDLVYEYFRMLSEGTDVALLIYNTPASGKVLSHQLIERISDLDTVVGMKHGIGSLSDTIRVRERWVTGSWCPSRIRATGPSTWPATAGRPLRRGHVHAHRQAAPRASGIHEFLPGTAG